ncbi:hypothetical protein M758_N012400 [Ceratodon purpureus]|nr:hypothetical protein M758_N012400 [Ceratodon purpureus]
MHIAKTLTKTSYPNHTPTNKHPTAAAKHNCFKLVRNHKTIPTPKTPANLTSQEQLKRLRLLSYHQLLHIKKRASTLITQKPNQQFTNHSQQFTDLRANQPTHGHSHTTPKRIPTIPKPPNHFPHNPQKLLTARLKQNEKKLKNQ